MAGVVRFSHAFPPDEKHPGRLEQGMLEIQAEDLTFEELLDAFSRFALMFGFSQTTIDNHLDVDGAVERAIRLYTH